MNLSLLLALLKAKNMLLGIDADLKQFKVGWKTPIFWITLLGHVVTLASMFMGFLSPQIALIVMTSLTVLYNLARGWAKAEDPNNRAWYKTTEAWMSILTYVANTIASLQQGGIDPKWLGTSSIILGSVMTTIRDIAHQSVPDTQPTNNPQ